MKKFIVIVDVFGREKREPVYANNSREAIDKTCEKFDVGYEAIINIEEKEA